MSEGGKNEKDLNLYSAPFIIAQFISSLEFEIDYLSVGNKS